MRKPIRLTIEGSGEFPWDMLRYDNCWPSAAADVPAMVLPRWKAGRNLKRRVTVASVGPFTSERWASFGWRPVGFTPKPGQWPGSLASR